MRTNQHFTLKQNPLRRPHLDKFVACYAPGRPRFERAETEQFKPYTYDEIVAGEIVEDLTAALAEFEAVAASLENTQTAAEANGDLLLQW